MLAMNLKIKRHRKAWKKINVEKLNNVWRDLVVSMSFICREHVEKYANQIRLSIKSAKKIAVFWNRSFSKMKFYWNNRCVEIVTTTKRKKREWTTTHSKKVWRNYLRVSNEKKKRSSIERKKWNFVESFASFLTRRRISNVSFVERSRKIIDQKRFSKYLI